MSDAEPRKQPTPPERRGDQGEDYGAKAVEDRNEPRRQAGDEEGREPEDPEAD
jgi:hypothetical protein